MPGHEERSLKSQGSSLISDQNQWDTFQTPLQEPRSRPHPDKLTHTIDDPKRLREISFQQRPGSSRVQLCKRAAPALQLGELNPDEDLGRSLTKVFTLIQKLRRADCEVLPVQLEHASRCDGSAAGPGYQSR